MHIRHFTQEFHKQVPGQPVGLLGRPILRDARDFPATQKSNQPANDQPLLVEKPLGVISLYFEPHASMEEHSADHPILFMVIIGKGKLRSGGPNGETTSISAGDAILWPPNIDHKVWTEGEALQGIAFEMLNQEKPA